MLPNEDSGDVATPEEGMLNRSADEAARADKERSESAGKKALAAESLTERLQKLHEKRVGSDQRWRKWFLFLFSGVLVFTVIGTGYGLYSLIAAKEFKGVVAAGFFGSVVVQVMGLTVVIAKFFFPEGGGNTTLPEGLGKVET